MVRRFSWFVAPLLALVAVGVSPAGAADSLWRVGRGLPQRRVGAGAVVGSRGTIYVVGGEGHQDADAVYDRDPVGERWHVALRLPWDRLGAAVVRGGRT